MRRFALALVIATSATSASAADPVGFLRGAIIDGVGAPHADWSGFYAGAHAATGVADMNFSTAGGDIVARMLDGLEIESVGGVSQWPVMGKKSNQGSGWGGFVGYNAQWGQAVLGIEANYTKVSYAASDGGSMGRRFSIDTRTYNVLYEAEASAQIHDMGSVRLKAGYAFANFLPYAFGGMSFGLADIYRFARVSGTVMDIAPPNDPPDNPPLIYGFLDQDSENQKGHFIYGYAFGGGLDMMIFENAFLRGEVEYLKFTSPIDMSVTTVRAGLGMRF